MQFILLFPILFIVDSSIPIREEIQNLIFPLAALLLGVWSLWVNRKSETTCLGYPLLGWGLVISLIVWSLVRWNSNLYNADLSLLWLGSILALLCVQETKSRLTVILFLTTVAIQCIAWLEVFGIRLYGNKAISVVTSIFNQKNHFQLFSIPLAAVCAILFWDKGGKWKFASVFISVSAIAFCVLSDSDAGIVALLASLIALIWFRWVQYPWLHLLPALAILSWMYLPWIAPLFWNHLGHSESVLSRVAIWDSAIRAIHASPWVGHGFGAFQTVIRDHATQIPELKKYVDTGIIGAAHNHYLHTWLELGFVGFILEQTFILSALIGMWKWARRLGGIAWLWFGIPLFVALFISITIPSQVFFSARIGVWAVILLCWIHIARVEKLRIIPQRWMKLTLLVSFSLIVLSWSGEERRLESWRIMAPEIVSGKVTQERLYVIPNALEADLRNPYALWYMVNGLYSAGEFAACLQVLDRMDSTSGHFFDTPQFRKKCSR